MYDWQTVARGALQTLGGAVQRQGFPTWLRIFEDPGSATGLRIDSAAGPIGLLGWRAPEDCLAVGMVATGRGRLLGTETYAGAAEDASEDRADGVAEGNALAERFNAAGGVLPMRMACVVSRSGEIGWWMELPDGTAHTDPPGEGRMLDVLLRCLGLSTSPPVEPASEIHTAAWLASVIEGGVSSARRLTWSDVERLHPLALVLSGDLDFALIATDDEAAEARRELADLVRISASAWSWEEIRVQAAGGELEALIDAGLAAWMDEGMFSRWLLSIVPTIDQLLEVAVPMLVPSAARRLAHAVHRSTPAQTARSASR